MSLSLSLSLSWFVTGVLCRFPLRLLNFSKKTGNKNPKLLDTHTKKREPPKSFGFSLQKNKGPFLLKDVLFEVPSGVSRESGRADARGDDDDDDDGKRRR